MPINRSFLGRNRGVDNHGGRLPPGQSLTESFPVLTSGPAPRPLSEAEWALTLKVGPRLVAQWTLADFRALPQSEQVVDIHCVTTWSKFDTRWRGVTVSYFEWVQDFSSFFWSEDEINARLDRIMTEAFDAIWQLAGERGLSLRTAAFVIGCSRVLAARATRGLYP